MITNRQLDVALGTAEPVKTLRALIEDLARKGSSRADLYGLLERYLVALRERLGSHEREEEAVLDVMDALSNWCHPGARLLPEEPTAGSS